jgi:predicted alpha/beta hydrolase family esterase
VNHRDLVAMHAALAEVRVLYATASVHTGWDDVQDDGVIPYGPKSRIVGGHAFAVVGYDADGFWLQNSWGATWGAQGFARISYDDWLANGSDVWVARLGAPVRLAEHRSVATGIGASSGGSRSYAFCDLRPHVVSLGNEGRLREGGEYGTSAADVAEIFERVGADAVGRRRLLLYAHGGLVPEESAIQKVADLRTMLLAAGVYPISLIWKTDFWSTITNVLSDAVRRRRPEGMLDAAKDFMLDRADDMLEPLARVLTGKLVWDEMKENARRASEPGGGLLVVAEHLRRLRAAHPKLEVHLVGHSAGSILLAGLISRLRDASDGTPVPIASCTLWAPACTMALYREHYLPAARVQGLGRFTVFTLTRQAERDDSCARIYNKSLLYLVSNAFEERLRRPSFTGDGGEPLLGMEEFIRRLPKAEQQFTLVTSPNAEEPGSDVAARATTHGGFDDDEATLRATLARILGRPGPNAAVTRHRSAAAQQDRRRALTGAWAPR